MDCTLCASQRSLLNEGKKNMLFSSGVDWVKNSTRWILIISQKLIRKQQFKSIKNQYILIVRDLSQQKIAPAEDSNAGQLCLIGCFRWMRSPLQQPGIIYWYNIYLNQLSDKQKPYRRTCLLSRGVSIVVWICINSQSCVAVSIKLNKSKVTFMTTRVRLRRASL